MSSLKHLPVRRHVGSLAMALTLTVFTCVSFNVARAQNIIQNPGFELDKTGWGLFVPEESQPKNCQFVLSSKNAHSGSNGAEISSDDFARYSLTVNAPIPIKSGERYRVSLWVKAGPGAEVKEGTPGCVLRLVLRNGNSDTTGGGAIFIGMNGKVTVRPNENLSPLSTPVPKDWTKVEAVVEIPVFTDGVDNMVMGLFGWYTKGTIYVDDVSVEKVSETTPVSPVSVK